MRLLTRWASRVAQLTYLMALRDPVRFGSPAFSGPRAGIDSPKPQCPYAWLLGDAELSCELMGMGCLQVLGLWVCGF